MPIFDLNSAVVILNPTFRELHYTSNEFHSNPLPCGSFSDLSQNYVTVKNQKYFKV